MKFDTNYKDNLKEIEYLYLTAFPKNERKPFDLILEKCNNGSIEIISIQNDNSNFLGFAIMILHDDMVLLDYFAIAPESRGQNLGSTALKMLFERYNNKRFILEIENTEIESDNLEERKRRKAFYLKNGMSVMPYKVNLIGVEMEILTRNCDVTYEEYYSTYENTFSDEYCCKIEMI
ncbi:GNAT family N-acetyltransferase [Ruminococcus sp.]|uniref:GNAT family N-acetyltransferase n=1 Tax=Ruminococcus sp. TaxID=41978 RepID=UPI0025CBE27B|nr:GNAT family N-acetyltransferase [Ruminococcus sp.]MCI6616152.1 GNAT family N-acetyltransferase [Ruminococcus sp.]